MRCILGIRIAGTTHTHTHTHTQRHRMLRSSGFKYPKDLHASLSSSSSSSYPRASHLSHVFPKAHRVQRLTHEPTLGAVVTCQCQLLDQRPKEKQDGTPSVQSVRLEARTNGSRFTVVSVYGRLGYTVHPQKKASPTAANTNPPLPHLRKRGSLRAESDKVLPRNLERERVWKGLRGEQSERR